MVHGGVGTWEHIDGKNVCVSFVRQRFPGVWSHTNLDGAVKIFPRCGQYLPSVNLKAMKLSLRLWVGLI